MDSSQISDSQPTPREIESLRVDLRVIQAVLSAILLTLVTNRHAIYEEDQMAKTAQIMYLAQDSHWAHLHDATDYYKKDLFSAYYLAATAFYKLSHLPALESLTVSAAWFAA